MTSERFFELFLEEIKNKPQVWNYYKFHTDVKIFLFRKAYFCQRLDYVLAQITNRDAKIIDIGCGYGTTALFLAMNGIALHGTTLEFYMNDIDERIQYWNQYGNANLFTISYEDVFDQKVEVQYDYIIIQDTLHHMEPLHEAILIIKRLMKLDCKMIVIEENGDNIVQNLKLIKQRGFKKTKYIYDETLKKEILIGDENIRGYEKWKSLFSKAGLKILEETQHYIRYYYPNKFTKENYQSLIDAEQNIWKQSAFKRKYFFFGMNFIVKREN